MFKSLKKPKHQEAFLQLLMHQQNDLGRYAQWAPAYKKKLEKKGVELGKNIAV